MVEVTYTRWHIPTNRLCKTKAYFPSYKCAMVLIANWRSDNWRYTVNEVKEMETEYEKIHPDVWVYEHLWR